MLSVSRADSRDTSHALESGVGPAVCIQVPSPAESAMGKSSYRTGGTRGGRDQFSWEDVKDDKDRSNYLGHSIHASVGRWQRGKNLHWYANGKTDQSTADQLEEEKRQAREAEEDMMRARLGLPPMRRQAKAPSVNLDQREMKELLKREGPSSQAGMLASSSGAADPGSSTVGDAQFEEERIGGLGSYHAPRHTSDGPIRSTIVPEDRLEGTGMAGAASLAVGWERVERPMQGADHPSGYGGDQAGDAIRRAGADGQPRRELDHVNMGDSDDERRVSKKHHHHRHHKEKHKHRDKDKDKEKKHKLHKEHRHHHHRSHRDEDRRDSAHLRIHHDSREPGGHADEAPRKRQRHDSESED